MANYLTITSLEKEIGTEIMPRLERIMLATPDVPPAAVQAAMMQCIYENPKLLECTKESLLLSASTAGHLALRPGKTTGNLWLIPRSNKGVKMCNAELGYKGLSTIAARAGRNIESGVIRKFDTIRRISMGLNPDLDYEPNLDQSDAAIIASWSVQEFQGRRVSLKIVPVKYILTLKGQFAKSAGGNFSPWDNPAIGFAAMAEKTAILMQRRNIPWSMFHYAAAMDDQHMMGRPAWIAPDDRTGQSTIIDADGVDRGAPIVEPPEPDEDLPPQLNAVDFILFTGPGKQAEFNTAEKWRDAYIRMLRETGSQQGRDACVKANSAKMMEIINAGYDDEAKEVQNVINELTAKL